MVSDHSRDFKMVSICLECNRDTDTLENKNAGHDPNCPTKKKCMKCKKDYFYSYYIPTVTIKYVKFEGENHHEYYDCNLCHGCQLDIASQLGVTI